MRESPIGDDDNEEVRQRAAFRAKFPSSASTQLYQNNVPATRPEKLMHHSPERLPSPITSLKLSLKAPHDLTSDDQLSENNDFCSACGGSGFLLCCDGCDRSFHFSCLDPPLNDDASELNEPWYCYICVAKRPVTSESTEKPQNRLFAPLLGSLKKCNPSNFALPPPILEYFEGVSADKHGNFVEAVGTRTR